MKIFNAFSRFSMSVAANTLLSTVATSVALAGIGLTGLFLVTYVQETPEVIKLKCVIGIEHPACPDKEAEYQIKNLNDKIAEMEGKLSDLAKVEEAVDTVTLFKHIDLHGDMKMTVGTVYSKLIDPEKTPNYFCYIKLKGGHALEDRNLYIRNSREDVTVSKADLAALNIPQATFSDARSQCKPYLIAGGA